MKRTHYEKNEKTELFRPKLWPHWPNNAHCFAIYIYLTWSFDLSQNVVSLFSVVSPVSQLVRQSESTFSVQSVQACTTCSSYKFSLYEWLGSKFPKIKYILRIKLWLKSRLYVRFFVQAIFVFSWTPCVHAGTRVKWIKHKKTFLYPTKRLYSHLSMCLHVLMLSIPWIDKKLA